MKQYIVILISSNIVSSPTCPKKRIFDIFITLVHIKGEYNCFLNMFNGKVF